MIRFSILFVPLLLGACVGGSWPDGSYTPPGAAADVTVLAPAISDCADEIVPYHSAVTLVSTDPVMTPALTDELVRSGLTLGGDGLSIRYVVAPFEAGEFIRVMTPHGICSEYFTRLAGDLKPGGPITVIVQ